jgi:hypothetical protein
LTYFEGGQLVILHLLDLSTGQQTATIRVMNPLSIQSVFTFDGYIWILGQDQLWRWDPELTPVREEKDYTTNRYAYDDPDKEGLAALQERVGDLGYTLTIGEEVAPWLAEQTYDPAYGARPLRRAVQTRVEDPLAEKIIASSQCAVTQIRLGVKDDALQIDCM